MAAKYPAFLGVIVLDATNNTIIFDEGGGNLTATIAAGPYFLRNGGDADCIIKAIADAFTAAGGTYSVDQVQQYISTGALYHVAWQISKSTGTFSVQWGHASTTFPLAAIGVASGTVGPDTVVTNTVHPSANWVGNEALVLADEEFVAASAQNRMAGGQLFTFDRGGAFDDRPVRLQYATGDRTYDELDSGVQSFELWWKTHRDGRRFEVHESTQSSDVLSLSSATLLGTYVLSEEACSRFAPERLQDGVPLFSWDLGLRGYTA